MKNLKKILSPKVSFIGAEQYNETQWDLTFKVLTPSCASSSGDFKFVLNFIDKDGEYKSINKLAPNWSSSDGSNFYMTFTESLNGGDKVTGVSRIFAIRYECLSNIKNLDNPKNVLDAINPCNKKEKTSKAVIETIEILFQIAYIYDVFSGGSSNVEDMLDKLTKEMSKLEKKLNTLIKKIDQVILLIEALPEIFKRELDRKVLEQNISSARGYVQLINAAMKADNVEDNIDLLVKYRDDLQIVINQIIGVSPPIHELVAATPFLAVWLSTATTIEKVKSRRPEYDIQSPWENGLMIFAKEAFDSLYDDINETVNSYTTNLIPKMPTTDGFYELGTPYFDKVYRKKCPPALGIDLNKHECNFGDFSFYCERKTKEFKAAYARKLRDSDWDVDKFGNYFIKRIPLFSMGCSGLSITEGFYALEEPFINSDEHLAIEHLNKLKKDQSEIKHFYTVIDSLVKNRNKIYEVFKEPDNIWNNRTDKKKS